MKNIKMLFNELKQHKFFNELLNNSKNLLYCDTSYPTKLEVKRSFVETDFYDYVVTGATYSKNYSHGLQVTKKYYNDYCAKKFTIELYDMFVSDLEYYKNIHVDLSSKKYLFSDILLLKSFGLIEDIGDFFVVTSLYNDSQIINKNDVIFNDFIYKYLFNFIWCSKKNNSILFNKSFYIYVVFTFISIPLFVCFLDSS